MMLKIVAVSGTLVVAAVAAKMAEGAGIAPAGFWPVTFVGWLSALGTIAALVASGYALHKFSQKALIERLAAMEKHFDGEIESLKKHYDRELLELRDLHTHEMNSLSLALKERTDGFGGRLRETEDDLASLTTIVTGIASQMASSIEDRRHINAQLASILSTQERYHADRVVFERQLMQMMASIRPYNTNG
jgi:hypothetical protein